MFRFLRKLREQRRLTPEELAEQEQIRRQAEAERRRAETGMANQRIEGGGGFGGGGGGGGF
jgi:hypothetical protein